MTAFSADKPLPFGRACTRIFAAVTVLILLVMAGCSDDSSEGAGETEEEASQAFTYSIDPDLEPSRAEHPRPGETTAPLVAVQTPVGVAEMVANELLVQPRNDEELAQIKTQLGAEVVRQFTVGDNSEMALYMLRIDSEKASLDSFVEDMRAVSEGGETMGHMVFSSEAGARTMAAAVGLHRQEITADLTWVGKPSSINTMSSNEAPTGWTRNGTALGADAYDWPYFSATSTQGTGVGEAWSILDRAGRLDNKVKLAVLDAGFCPNDDFYESEIYDVALGTEDVVANIPPLPFTNDACTWSDWSALSTSGWHGTHVYSAMMGQHDNGFGSTGPASPVVDTPSIMAHMMYDTVTTLIALKLVDSDGAKIANMSYHIPIPYGLQWTHTAYSWAIKRFYDDGMLMFAAAGNEGENVDSHWTPGGVDMGESWQYLPCETLGVICVAGLAHDDTDLAGNSNFGPDSVDIAGPYTVAAGPDNDEPANAASTINGTSFASPYVAGVAALIWAADPSLSNTEVRDILYRTSLPGSYGDDVRNGYACALCAIRSIIPNTPPVIELISPQADSSNPEAEEIEFEVSVTDVEDIVLGETTQVTWYDGNQELHQGETFSQRLCPGVYDLRVEAIDSDGETTSLEFQIESVAGELTVAIAGPRLRDYQVEEANDGSLYAEDVDLAAAAFLRTCDDPDSTNIDESGLTWRDDEGNMLGTGKNLTVDAAELQNSYGDFISKKILLEFVHDSNTYSDETILSPCAIRGSGVSTYGDCSTSVIVGDMLERMGDALGDGAWEDPQRQADLIVDEIYGDTRDSLGLCPPEECDPSFPRLGSTIIGELYGDYHESSVWGLQQMLEAAQEGDFAAFDAAMGEARNALGRLDNMSEADRELLQRGVAVGAALAEFYLPESAGGQNRWEDMPFVTNPDNMTPTQIMRPVEAGLRGFLDSTTITDDPTSDLNVSAAEYSSLREATAVADELP